MMKAKQPGIVFEHLAKAVRSEGPVNDILSSLEDHSSSSLSHQLMPIFGTQVKKKKPQLLLKQKQKKLKTKRMIKQPGILYGSIGSMWQPDLIVPSKTS